LRPGGRTEQTTHLALGLAQLSAIGRMPERRRWL
jgi:hypothetical protein